MSGSLGDVPTFSFYENKLFSTGEGGMIVTNDANIYSRMKAHINLCFIDDDRFHYKEIGFDYRMKIFKKLLDLGN